MTSIQQRLDRHIPTQPSVVHLPEGYAEHCAYVTKCHHCLSQLANMQYVT